MPFADSLKNEMLDGSFDGVLDAIRLHSGDPGAAGTANALGAGLSAATFNAAASGARALASNVEVTGLAANQPVTHFSVWKTAGAVFRGSKAITNGDVQANAAGAYQLVAGTTVEINDPA